MEKNGTPEIPEESQEHYVPRPRWQIIGARIALIIFIIMVIVYYLNVAGWGI